MTWTHTRWNNGVPVEHTDSITAYTLNAACQNGSYAFNGGWIEVHEITDGGDVFLTSVDGNLLAKTFTYAGSPVPITLIARPDIGCAFDGWEAGPSTNTITVSGDGALPMAYFSCP
jgi:hypothetical protein